MPNERPAPEADAAIDHEEALALSPETLIALEDGRDDSPITPPNLPADFTSLRDEIAALRKEVAQLREEYASQSNAGAQATLQSLQQWVMNTNDWVQYVARLIAPTAESDEEAKQDNG
jgi:hypothetical protein